MKDLLDISVKSDAVELRMKKVAARLQQDITYAAAVYLVGHGGRGLKHYPAYKYITRKSAYGKTFQSDKQRKKVMAMIRSGEIDPGVPHRTGNMQRGWTVRPLGNGNTLISNNVPHVIFSHDNERQARLNRMAGWRNVAAIIESNTRGMLAAGNQAVKRLAEG